MHIYSCHFISLLLLDTSVILILLFAVSVSFSSLKSQYVYLSPLCTGYHGGLA